MSDYAEPTVDVVFADQVSSDFINDLAGWGFDEQTIQSSAGELLTLDIDFGRTCSLNCPFCFRKENGVDDNGRELDAEKLKTTILEAKSLGLRSVKFLGAGEPLENKGILEFVDFLHKLGLQIVIFTKTALFADDMKVSRLFSNHSIHTGLTLARYLFDRNVSLVQGCNSFCVDVQKKMMNIQSDYVERRNRTIEIFAEIGFNQTNPTRFALGINPVTQDNIDEVYDMYTWARRRNIYPVVTPTMISGREKHRWPDITPSGKELIDLYVAINIYNIDVGIITLAELEEQGIASYAGGRPCNQVAAGLYLTLNGQVLSCPGNEDLVEGNIWSNKLSEIWMTSQNRARAGNFNCKCVAKDGASIPVGFYSDVRTNIHQRLGECNEC